MAQFWSSCYSGLVVFDLWRIQREIDASGLDGVQGLQ